MANSVKEQFPNVLFRVKSDWQKDGCLLPDCEGPSTMEAVVPNAQVRCCEKPECMRHAAQLATYFADFPMGAYLRSATQEEGKR